MHELVSSKGEAAISGKAGNVRIAERSKFFLPEASAAFLFQETLGKFHLCAANVFYLSRLRPGRPVLGACSQTSETASEYYDGLGTIPSSR